MILNDKNDVNETKTKLEKNTIEYLNMKNKYKCITIDMKKRIPSNNKWGISHEEGKFKKCIVC